jgi:hypothetical protein
LSANLVYLIHPCLLLKFSEYVSADVSAGNDTVKAMPHAENTLMYKFVAHIHFIKLLGCVIQHNFHR